MPADHVRLTTQRAANARLIEINAGHDLHLQPDQWHHELRAFMARVT